MKPNDQISSAKNRSDGISLYINPHLQTRFSQSQQVPRRGPEVTAESLSPHLAGEAAWRPLPRSWLTCTQLALGEGVCQLL